MSQPMRGLTVFISDIRSCSTKELEQKRVNKELANIRSKFKDDKHLIGYQRKKYVCKLLYMYMLNYDIDFGHMEALTLLSSSKASEKRIGYLACALLLDENHDFLRLIVNSIHNDLISKSEIARALSLACVANICNVEMAEALNPDVSRLLFDPTASPVVKKKAALCLLKFLRKGVDVIGGTDNFVDRACILLEDRDLGLAMAVVSLLLGIVSRDPTPYEHVVPHVIRLLSRVVLNFSREYSPEYRYYDIPSPWLQVKTLRFLQYFEQPKDKGLRSQLMDVLTRIISTTVQPSGGTRSPASYAIHNASHAVLFEALNLVIGMDQQDEAILGQAMNMVGTFVSSKETANIRYLALDAMTRLVNSQGHNAMVQKHQTVVYQHLQDPDISIRRRALDLIYNMTDKNNAKSSVQQLLQYLTVAEINIRPELVLKIAILAEKFATDLTWYVDVVLQLLTLAGEDVSENIWWRVVQIVTNHEELQRYAAEKVFRAITSPNPAERLVKTAGYILGEFGHLISDNGASGAVAQVNALHAHFGTVSNATKGILLSAYIKMVNVHPETRTILQPIFNNHKDFIDPEIQQRAVEYSSLGSGDKDQLMNSVWEVMPNFPKRESVLLKSLEKQEEANTDQSAARTRTLSQQPDEEDDTAEVEAAVSGLSVEAPAETGNLIDAGAPAPADASTAGKSDMDLLGDLSAGAAPAPVAQPSIVSTQPPAPATAPQDPFGSPLRPTSDPTATAGPPGAPTPASVRDWFDHLATTPNGVLYEDSIVQLGLKSEYKGHQARVALFVGNKSEQSLESFTVSVASSPNLPVNVEAPPTSLGSKSQTPIRMMVSANGAFSSPPTATFQYVMGGQSYKFDLVLPIVTTKFSAPLTLNADSFMGAWRAVDASLEKQSVFKARAPVNVEALASILGAYAVPHTAGIDPNTNNLVGAATFTSAAGPINVMLRLEANTQQNMLRLSVRSTDGELAASLHSLLQKRLE